MRNFQGAFETRKQSFISDFSICMTVPLSDSYFTSKKPFNSFSKRFGRNNELFLEYNNIIKEQLKLNVVEKVPPSKTNNFDQVRNIHYLPHRPVIKDDRVTSKVRIVFDASSKVEGPSTEPLLPVILRFRANKIVFTVAIQKTFCNFFLNLSIETFAVLK